MIGHRLIVAPQRLRSKGGRSLNGGARPGAGRPKKRRVSVEIAEGRKRQRIEQQQQKEEQQQINQQLQGLSNPKGRSLSADTSNLLLRMMVRAMQQQGLTQTKMLKDMEDLTGNAYKTLHRLYTHWNNTGEVLVIDSSNRGGGSPKHIYHDTDLSTEHICSIHQFLIDEANNGHPCTSRNLIDHLKTTHSITIPARTIQSLLNRLGYKYGKANFIGAMNDVARRKRIRSFLYQYSNALQSKDTVIVYTDESYVNANHSSSYTWFAPSSTQSNNVKRPSGRGKRLIILHAISAHGPVVTRQRNKRPITSIDNIDEKCLSAELIFEAVEHDGDYHKCMNGDIYIKWLENRLIPTFKKLFPKKKMALVLDNASYHHVKGESWISPSSMKKFELACVLRELKISYMIVYRDDKNGQRKKYRFGQNAYFESGSKWAPTVVEMRKELRKYLDSNPGYQKTEVQKLFDKHGFKLIYTPPYTPTTQPIEMVWGYVKGYVARQFKNGRSMEMLRDQTLAGMYGNSDHAHEGVTADLCKKVISKCHRWCDSFIETDSELGGTVQSITANPDIDYSLFDIDDDEDHEADPFAGAAVESDVEDD